MDELGEAVFVGERKSSAVQAKRKTPAGNLSRKFNLHNVLILVFITEAQSNISPAVVCQVATPSPLPSLPFFLEELFNKKGTFKNKMLGLLF